MPIYEFHCDGCKKDSEILVRSSDWKGTKCPHCGSAKLVKKLSVFASSGGESAEPSCTTKPHSCGMCGTGRPNPHEATIGRPLRVFPRTSFALISLKSARSQSGRCAAIS